MKRFHEEKELMARRWRVVVDDNARFRAAWPTVEYRNRRVDRGGLGRMRKHRPNEGCGCHMCQWETWEKGNSKRKHAEMKHEFLAEGI